jgi:cytochrome P450 family 4
LIKKLEFHPTGPRNCIGQKFAMYELKSIISKVIKNFELSLPGNEDELEIYSDMILNSQNGVKLAVKKR